MIKLKLPHESGGYFGITKDVYAALKEETEEFLKGEEFLNSHEFARKVMLTHEIKANNTLEGIRDDITLIQSVINDASKSQRRKTKKTNHQLIWRIQICTKSWWHNGRISKWTLSNFK